MEYISINIGPVFTTLSMARKPREFWSASYLFSHLMKCIIQSVSKKALLLSPYMPSDSFSKVGLLPDRAYFKCSEKMNVNELVDDALKQFAKDVDIEYSVVRDYFNVMTVALEAMSDSGAISKMNNYLNYLELSNHTLSSISAGEIQKLLEKKYDSPLFRIAMGRKDFEVETLEDIASCELKKNKGFTHKSYHDYICIVQADGDYMGKVVTNLPDGKLGYVSELLMDFGRKACALVDNYGGLPVYAGGDDLLFIAPVWGVNSLSIFDLIQRIDRDYQKVADEVGKLDIKDANGNKLNTSMSYGVSITYHKFPLYEAWGMANDLLFNKAKLVKGKNAIAWNIQKHSGSSHEGVISKCDKQLYDAFIHIMKTASKETLVSAVAHKIRANEGLLGLWANADEKSLQLRMDAFFKNIIDIEGKGEHACKYLQRVNELMIQLYKSLQAGAVKEMSSLISIAYGMLRTAKFVNGEEDYHG